MMSAAFFLFCMGLWDGFCDFGDLAGVGLSRHWVISMSHDSLDGIIAGVVLRDCDWIFALELCFPG